MKIVDQDAHRTLELNAERIERGELSTAERMIQRDRELGSDYRCGLCRKQGTRDWLDHHPCGMRKG